MEIKIVKKDQVLWGKTHPEIPADKWDGFTGTVNGQVIGFIPVANVKGKALMADKKTPGYKQFTGAKYGETVTIVVS